MQQDVCHVLTSVGDAVVRPRFSQAKPPGGEFGLSGSVRITFSAPTAPVATFKPL